MMLREAEYIHILRRTLMKVQLGIGRAILVITAVMIVYEACLIYSYADEAQDTLNLTSPSAILMEASTGQIIYEKNSNERVAPGSNRIKKIKSHYSPQYPQFIQYCEVNVHTDSTIILFS